LELKGVGLSQNATFSIGDDDVSPAQIQGDLPEIVQKDATNNEPGFAKILRLNIAHPKANWLGANATLRITNPDQQEAVGRYTVAGALPAPAPAVVPAAAPAPAMTPATNPA
jgi:hypothetical protein